MFSSKKKNKQKKKSSGFDLPPGSAKPVNNLGPDIYHTVDDSKIVNTDNGSNAGSSTGFDIGANVSDDFKIDSLKKNSGKNGGANNTKIPAAPPVPANNLIPPAPPPPPPPPPPPIAAIPPAPPPPPPAATTVQVTNVESPPPPPLPPSLSTNTIPIVGARNQRKKAPPPEIQKQAFDNPVFMQENGPVPQGNGSVTLPRLLKGQQNQFPGLPNDNNNRTNDKRKVSWNNTIVYSSGAKTDIVISGLHADESGSDEPPTPKLPPKNFRIHDDNHSVDTLDTKSSFDDIPPVLAYSDDGSDVEERPKRMFRDRRDLEAHRRRQQRSRSRSKRSDNRGYKCALCVTLVVLAFCVVGLAVLGTLYGVEYVNKLSSVEQKDELVNVFNLQQTPKDAVFIKCTYRPPYIEALDGAYYFLLDEDGIMPWQSPHGRATLTWLKGESVKTYTIDRVGRLSTHVLGDPAVVPGAQYTLSMDNTDWFAARGLGKYAFVALNTIGTFGKFVDANVTSLLMKVGSDDQNLLQELRQFTRA